MRWLLLVAVSVFLNAYEANILSVTNDTARIDAKIKKGMSGIVLCPYNGKNIICAKAVANGDKIRFYTYKALKNDAFALPVVYPKKGDRVVFAKDYNRILIIAPNQAEYIKIKDNYKNDTVISPDVFAAQIEDVPGVDDFREFCQKMNIGKIVFVLDKTYEVDAYSFYVIKQYGQNSVDYKNIFFTTYPKFDIKTKNIIAYYKSLIKE